MTTHILKTPCPLDAVKTRCGMALTGDGPKPSSGDRVVGEKDGLCWVNCIACLRDLVIDARLEKLRFADSPKYRWLVGGDTGTSSATIWCVMMGITPGQVDRTASVPHDPADFGRCHNLLELFPEWRARLPEMARTYSSWEGLVGAWDELTALYLKASADADAGGDGMATELADRMKEL